ncbi:deoxyribose-phosphate aldolase [Candidatus Methylacidithermus pantelleriae]|uniref:Deoxyribose-phosphate aldolase n=1 Tax=Candidatus Methylacidithermus pantelleriae TaxID=2744239 RepID=A0A8J2BT22_9BACT|nr:deoxyribose-phosphate aldolase [Candidatus Methylacidithermus pantelleriae]CAF0705295.1 Deoxyribose-phosphate aldolase [Candidatus Methylacidithermus pantelleriae]
MNPQILAARIDHTLLSPTAGQAEIARLCDEALQHGFGCVCVAPRWVSLAKSLLKGSTTKIASVVAFPLGHTLPSVKKYETLELVALGVDEVDCVIDLAAAKMGNWRELTEDLEGVVNAAGGRLVKAIIEAACLSDAELDETCRCVMRAGAAFVKTSTGFGFPGATTTLVRRIKQIVGDSLRIKASGGIRTLEQAIALLEAGADRLGTTASVAIMDQLRSGTSPSRKGDLG